MNDPTIPQSPNGGIHPELRARITAATAAVADFDREVNAYLAGTGDDDPRPDMASWAYRFRAELAGILSTLGEPDDR